MAFRVALPKHLFPPAKTASAWISWHFLR